MSNAKNNRTLLGIDFLEQAGIVMDLAQRTWHFKDNPNTIFEFKMQTAETENYVSLTEANVRNHNAECSALDSFMSWFEKRIAIALKPQKANILKTIILQKELTKYLRIVCQRVTKCLRKATCFRL